MAVSAIDTLMQIATPPRAPEPPAGSPAGGNKFAPALEKAYSEEKPRESTAPSKEEDVLDDEPETPIVETATSKHPEKEGAEKTDEVNDAPAPTEEAEQADEESAEDEAAISDLAGSAATANKMQEAAAAEQETAATHLKSIKDHGQSEGGEGDPQNVTASAPTDGEAQAEAGEQSTALAATLLSQEAETAEGVETTPAKSNGKKPKEAKAAGIDATAATKAAADVEESPTAENAGEQPVTDTQPKAEEAIEPTSDSEQSRSESGEASKSAGVERMKLPQAEPAAELAAAIERHVAQLEQAVSGAPEAPVGNNIAAPEAVNQPPAAQRAAATLDRLAAASMRRGDNPASTEGGPAIDRPRFVQRVEGALRAAQQRDGRVQVRLAPPELGSLRIELSVQNGAMTAKLEAETPAARNALLDNLPALRDRLAEQNIRVEKFDVDIRRDSHGGGGHDGLPDRPDDRREQEPHQRRNHVAPTPAKTPAPRAMQVAATANDTGLDVRI